MSFTYSTIKTETLEEGTRLFLGYNVSSSGVAMNVRLQYQTPGNVPTKEHTFYLPGDTVSGLQSGMSGSPFTALKTDDLGNNVTRYVRAYKTPAGNVILHDYMKVTLTIENKTHVIHADEHFCVIEAASLSGTDIVKTGGKVVPYLSTSDTVTVSGYISPSFNPTFLTDLQTSIVANSGEYAQVHVGCHDAQIGSAAALKAYLGFTLDGTTGSDDVKSVHTGGVLGPIELALSLTWTLGPLTSGTHVIYPYAAKSVTGDTTWLCRWPFCHVLLFRK